MMIAGIKGISLIDYPGKIATVLYTTHCNFRCPFCHNSELVLGHDITPVSREDVMARINKYRGFIDGVVITGGEPTINTGLAAFINEIRELGFFIKLDTNGSNPDILQKLLEARIIDYVAMDLKTSWIKYNMAAGVQVNQNHLLESIDVIKKAQLDHEFRTTCVPGIVDEDDIEEISKLIGRSEKYTLQQFSPGNSLDPAYRTLIPYPGKMLEHFREIASRNVSACRLTGC